MPDADREAEFREAVVAVLGGIEEQLMRLADAAEARAPARPAAAVKPRATPPPAVAPRAASADPPPLELKNVPRPDDWKYLKVGMLPLPEEFKAALGRHGVRPENTLAQLSDVGPHTAYRLKGMARRGCRAVGEALKAVRAPREEWERWLAKADR